MGFGVWAPASLKLMLEVMEYGNGAAPGLAENPFTDADHAALMKELDWLEEVRAAYAEEKPDDPE